MVPIGNIFASGRPLDTNAIKTGVVCGQSIYFQDSREGEGKALVFLPYPAAHLQFILRQPIFDCPTFVFESNAPTALMCDLEQLARDLDALAPSDGGPLYVFGFSSGSIFAALVASYLASPERDVRLLLANPRCEWWPQPGPVGTVLQQQYDELTRLASEDQALAKRLQSQGEILSHLSRALGRGLKLGVIASGRNRVDAREASRLANALQVNVHRLPTSDHHILAWLIRSLAPASGLEAVLAERYRSERPTDDPKEIEQAAIDDAASMTAFWARHRDLQTLSDTFCRQRDASPTAAAGPSGTRDAGQSSVLPKTDVKEIQLESGHILLYQDVRSGPGRALLFMPSQDAEHLRLIVRQPIFDCRSVVFESNSPIALFCDARQLAEDMNALFPDDGGPTYIFGFHSGTPFASLVASYLAAPGRDIRLLLANPRGEWWPQAAPAGEIFQRQYDKLAEMAAGDPVLAARLQDQGQVFTHLVQAINSGLRLGIIASEMHELDAREAARLASAISAEVVWLPTDDHYLIPWIVRTLILRPEFESILFRETGIESAADRPEVIQASPDTDATVTEEFWATHPRLLQRLIDSVSRRWDGASAAGPGSNQFTLPRSAIRRDRVAGLDVYYQTERRGAGFAVLFAPEKPERLQFMLQQVLFDCPALALQTSTSGVLLCDLTQLADDIGRRFITSEGPIYVVGRDTGAVSAAIVASHLAASHSDVRLLLGNPVCESWPQPRPFGEELQAQYDAAAKAAAEDPAVGELLVRQGEIFSHLTRAGQQGLKLAILASERSAVDVKEAHRLSRATGAELILLDTDKRNLTPWMANSWAPKGDLAPILLDFNRRNGRIGSESHLEAGAASDARSMRQFWETFPRVQVLIDTTAKICQPPEPQPGRKGGQAVLAKSVVKTGTAAGHPFYYQDEMSGVGVAFMFMPCIPDHLKFILRRPVFDCPTAAFECNSSTALFCDLEKLAKDLLEALPPRDGPIYVFGFSSGSIFASVVGSYMSAPGRDVRIVLGNPLCQWWPQKQPFGPDLQEQYGRLQAAAADDPKLADRLTAQGDILVHLDRASKNGLRLGIFVSERSAMDLDEARRLTWTIGGDLVRLPTAEHDVLPWLIKSLNPRGDLVRIVADRYKRSHPEQDPAKVAANARADAEEMWRFWDRYPNLQDYADGLRPISPTAPRDGEYRLPILPESVLRRDSAGSFSAFYQTDRRGLGRAYLFMAASDERLAFSVRVSPFDCPTVAVSCPPVDEWNSGLDEMLGKLVNLLPRTGGPVYVFGAGRGALLASIFAARMIDAGEDVRAILLNPLLQVPTPAGQEARTSRSMLSRSNVLDHIAQSDFVPQLQNAVAKGLNLVLAASARSEADFRRSRRIADATGGRIILAPTSDPDIQLSLLGRIDRAADRSERLLDKYKIARPNESDDVILEAALTDSQEMLEFEERFPGMKAIADRKADEYLAGLRGTGTYEPCIPRVFIRQTDISGQNVQYQDARTGAGRAYLFLPGPSERLQFLVCQPIYDCPSAALQTDTLACLRSDRAETAKQLLSLLPDRHGPVYLFAANESAAIAGVVASEMAMAGQDVRLLLANPITRIWPQVRRTGPALQQQFDRLKEMCDRDPELSHRLAAQGDAIPHLKQAVTSGLTLQIVFSMENQLYSEEAGKLASATGTMPIPVATSDHNILPWLIPQLAPPDGLTDWLARRYEQERPNVAGEERSRLAEAVAMTMRTFWNEFIGIQSISKAA